PISDGPRRPRRAPLPARSRPPCPVASASPRHRGRYPRCRGTALPTEDAMPAPCARRRRRTNRRHSPARQHEPPLRRLSSQTPSLDGLLRHRLLLEPHGFEGFWAVRVHLHRCHASIANGEDQRALGNSIGTPLLRPLATICPKT